LFGNIRALKLGGTKRQEFASAWVSRVQTLNDGKYIQAMQGENIDRKSLSDAPSVADSGEGKTH
jgi:hypothetical protein